VVRNNAIKTKKWRIESSYDAYQAFYYANNKYFILRVTALWLARNNLTYMIVFNIFKYIFNQIPQELSIHAQNQKYGKNAQITKWSRHIRGLNALYDTFMRINMSIVAYYLHKSPNFDKNLPNHHIWHTTNKPQFYHFWRGAKKAFKKHFV